MGLEPADLARWTRFAAKGGIGKCMALCDCVAESSDDLMFLKDDEITVLLQIPDMEGFYLGYCEGVVGRFSGLDVSFIGRLKKPVMTKRVSLGASSNSAAIAKEGKSPTPSTMGTNSTTQAPSPVPYQYSQRRDGQDPRQPSSRRASPSSPPSRTLERRGSGPQSRLTSPLSHSHVPSTSSSPSTATRTQELDDERGIFGLGLMHPPPMSYSSSSTLSDSALSTPSFSAFPVHSETQDYESKNPTRDFSPRATEFPVVVESSSSSSSNPPTRASSPLEMSISTNIIPATHKYTSNAPAPLKFVPEATNFFPEANISPLRIYKRMPTSPPAGTYQTTPYSPPPSSSTMTSPTTQQTFSTNDHEASSPGLLENHTHALAPLSSVPPDTSRSFASFASFASGQLSSDDAQVGIGLSLLQDLANGMDSSDEDEDGAAQVRRRLRYSNSSVRSGIGQDSDEAVILGDSLGRAGHRTQDSIDGSQDGTVDGLMYDGFDDDEDEEAQPPPRQRERTSLDLAGNSSSNPSNISPLSVSNAILAPATSPMSGLFGGNPPHSPIFGDDDDERERRPSVAPSAASTGSWEGASDIYDDYRYSRFSMASKASMSSRFSVNAVATSSGTAPTPPVPDSRPTLDSASIVVGSGRQRVDSTRSRVDSSRSRTDSAKSRPHSPHFLPQVMEADDGNKEEGEGNFGLAEENQEEEPTKDRKMSVDSETSVYTQNSRLSTLSNEVSSFPPPTSNDQFQRGPHPPSSSSPLQPKPLNATQRTSPLLHTSWGSDASSSSAVGGDPGNPSTKSSMMPASALNVVSQLEVGQGLRASTNYSSSNSSNAVTGEVNNRHGTPTPQSSPVSPNFASARRTTVEDGSKSPDSNQMGGLVSPIFGGGFASRMRQQVEEEDRKSPNPAVRDKSFDSSQDVSGLGNRIVVEDEDELPSRILNSTFDESFSSSPERQRTPEVSLSSSPSIFLQRRHVDRNLSPSPEPVLQHRLAPLIVANRTPSPSPSIAETFPSEPPSPLVPSIPPPSSTSTPPLTQILPAASSSSSPLSVAQTPSHIRPPKPNATGSSFPEQNRRRSIFLPHPNAPKLLAPTPPVQRGFAAQGVQQQQGPMGLHPSQQQQMGQRGPPRPHLFGVIYMALSMPPRPLPPQSQPPPRPGQPPQQQQQRVFRGPTIYGRTETDLGAALGPVPMIWSVDPPPPILATAPPNANAAQNSQASTMGSPPRGPTTNVTSGQQQQQARSMSIGPGSVASNATVKAEPKDPGKVLSATPGISSTTPVSTQALPAPAPSSASTPEPQQGGGVIHRANFFPKAAGMRPRSRSFSGFGLTSSEVPLPKAQTKGKSRDESEVPTARDVKRSLTATAPLSNAKSTPSSRARRPSAPGSAGGLKPSVSSQGLRSPSSPLAQSVFVAPDPTEEKESPPSGGSGPSISPSVSSDLPNRATPQVRQVSSRATLNESQTNDSSSNPMSGPNGSSRPIPISRTTLDSAPPTSSPLAGISSGRKTSIQVGNASSSSSSPSPRLEADNASVSSDSRSHFVSQPPNQRQASLRSKLSLPNLRRKQSRLNTEDEPLASPTSITGSQVPHIPDAAEMLQVKDMEFELVRPNFAHFQGSARTSEDSGVLGREGSMDQRQDGYLRPESPAVSVSSGGGGHSPSVEVSFSANVWPQPPTTTPAGPSRPTTESESSMEAHRNRELKWMSLMSSSPASQSRKSKKVKKLLLDGVPSSVRYLVWSYLTDGKARCVPGVYAQLCARGRVPASKDVESDIKRCFLDQPHLQGTQGPVLSLLQAYLNMVPDIQYSMGLTLIVGQLLLLSPEEDAFWIFVSIMDSHIRPYFSSSTTQMEVDAALFSRALESNDSQVGKKVFVNMGVLPGRICAPWFSTLFVGSLPPEYLNRMWDIFLFEGVPFLLRVALALVTCCRRRVLECTSEESLLALLLHPPHSSLPPTPDAFISLAFSVKLKDDDIRKQRIKMEAQVKRQTQVPRAASSSAPFSGIISLPRL